MIEAVIFDCDGVLVDSEVLALEVELRALAEIGLAYDESEFKTRFMGMSAEALFDAIDDDHRARFGRALPAGFRGKCKERYRAAWHRLVEVPGARRAVRALSVPKAVASSSTVEGLTRKLHATGLWELFAPHIYSADHVAHAKPAPDLFLHAAEGLGIAPARCIVFEDSINGVRAARAAGMMVLGFTGGGHMEDSFGQKLLKAGASGLVRHWDDAGDALFALARS